MGYGSYVAAVAEVSVSKEGRLKIHRIVAATNPGHAVNPAQIERQVAGSFVFGLSAMIYGECTVNRGAIEQTNVARVIGPALGGGLVLTCGPASPFFINTVFYAAVIALLFGCLPRLPPAGRDGRRIAHAVLDGVRHTLGSAATRATLVRSGGYAFFASLYFSLLPLIARNQVAGGPGVYGLLLGCLGAGGILAVILLPRWRLR